MDKVTVFGSFVVDLMARTPHLPKPAETVKGSVFKQGPGGKGFNQGVAAYKAGANMAMVTKLGKDSFGKVALDEMKNLGMKDDYIFYSDDESTGVALIIVDENTSQNEIAVVLGACNTITDSEVDTLDSLLDESQYILIQLETNISAINKVIEKAYYKNIKVILNTAPIQHISDDILSKVWLVTPNEIEAEILTGIEIDSKEAADKAAKVFFEKGVKNVLITLGSRGVYVSTGEESILIPAFKVKAIDTTGAGDAFNGGLVTALCEGKDMLEAVIFANALAALSVQKLGTTPSMPTRKEIDEFLRERSL